MSTGKTSQFDSLLGRLTSRKFWVAVGGFVTFVANGAYSEALYVVLFYLGIEGGADVASRLKTNTDSTQAIIDALAPSQEDDFSAVDTKGKTIVSGRVFRDDDDMDPVK